jgi:hypothetical protein
MHQRLRLSGRRRLLDGERMHRALFEPLELRGQSQMRRIEVHDRLPQRQRLRRRHRLLGSDLSHRLRGRLGVRGAGQLLVVGLHVPRDLHGRGGVQERHLLPRHDVHASGRAEHLLIVYLTIGTHDPFTHACSFVSHPAPLERAHVMISVQ